MGGGGEGVMLWLCFVTIYNYVYGICMWSWKRNEVLSALSSGGLKYENKK